MPMERNQPERARWRGSKGWKLCRRWLPRVGSATLAPAVALAALAGAGCGDFGRRYWTPTADQLRIAEQIAKFHVFTNLSDQAGPAAVSKVTLGENGLPSEYPVAFTIGETPYVRYRTKLWGAIRRGIRVIHVQYFDPSAIPDWERRDAATGEFPAWFEVVVDVAAGRALSDSRTPSPK